MEEHGGMKNFKEKQALLPCKNCFITWMQAGLEYPNGTNANVDSGMWLHHTVLSNVARKDTLGCGYKGDRFFASGNERSAIDLCASGYVFYLADLAMLTFTKQGKDRLLARRQ